MNLPKQIHTVLFTFIILHVIAFGEGVKSKNYKKILIAKLLNVINSSDVDTYVVNSNGRLKKVHLHSKKVDMKDLFQNRLLVKRLVPHGYGVSSYEYDSKFNTMYKPFVRVHGGKPRFIERKERNGYTNRVKSNQPKSIRNVLYNKEELLQLKNFKPKTVTFKSILDDVQTYVKKYDSTANMKKLKYAILGLLENYPNTHLRHRFATGSDEREMQNAKFGKVHEHEADKDKKKKSYPQYPFWNYWTYDMPIHQDICKGKLVQLGNLCVESPPH